uniref:Ig-like domain-containing protein n=1 Tax=Poecilia reticulata TaxID=8081 RepID=A0A3P9MTW5_POERE
MTCTNKTRADIVFIIWEIHLKTKNFAAITKTNQLFFAVNKKEVFNLGSDARLICSNSNWTKAVFVIWNIELKHKTCKISFNHEGQSFDSCNDGKSIQNSTDQSFLHIPNFSVNDVGAYKCESTWTGGNENYNIKVGAPPVVSAWLKQRGNKMVAVCRAERGIPAANISWSVTGNHSVTQQNDRDGFVTVESHQSKSVFLCVHPQPLHFNDKYSQSMSLTLQK